MLRCRACGQPWAHIQKRLKSFKLFVDWQESEENIAFVSKARTLSGAGPHSLRNIGILVESLCLTEGHFPQLLGQQLRFPQYLLVPKLIQTQRASQAPSHLI